MPECWNCAALEPEGHRFCPRCGQPLAPTPQERERLAAALAYLLREAERWDWMPPDPRTALQAEYTRRLRRLKAGPRPRASQKLAPTPIPRSAVPPTLPVEAEPRAAPAVEPVLDPVGQAAAPLGALSAFLEEGNIRWLLILGGLLLASAGIGLLYSQWTAHGRQLVAVALLLAPLVSFTAAIRLRPTLPVSSRILAAVGGLLLPTGLVAARLFELGGLRLPWPQWNLFAFTASAVTLFVLSSVLEEAFCLYLGTLALAGAAGALADLTGQPPVFGLACLATAAVYVLKARGRHPFATHLFGLGQTLAAVGLLSTLPNFVSATAGPPLPALVLLFLGALFFSGSGYLVGRPAAVVASAPVALAAIALCVLVYDLPAVTAGFGVLALGTGYLAGARALHDQPDRPEAADLAALSFTLGTALTGLALLLILGLQVIHGLLDDFAAVPVHELRLGAVVALLAAALYATTAFLFATPRLMYAATLCATWSWFLAAVLLHRQSPGFYPGDLSVLALLGVAAAWPLRRFVREPFLRPVVESCLLLASLPAPLSLAMRAFGARGADDATPWTLAVVAATFLLATPWLRAGWPLYFATGWGATAYALTLPLLLRALGYPTDPLNLGFAFLPLLALLGVAALRLQARAGAPYANPVAHVTLTAAVALALAQLSPAGEPRGLAALTLGLYAAGFAVFAHLYRDWRFLDTSARDLLAHLGAFAAAATAWVALGDGGPGSHAALLALAFLGVGAGSVLPHPARAALAHMALGCSVIVVLGGADSTPEPGLRTLFAYAPGLIWLFQARTAGSEPLTALSALGFAMGATALWRVGLPLEGDPLTALLLMGTAAWAYGTSAPRHPWATLPAWVAACLGCSALLDLARLTGDARLPGWWLFCAALAAAVWHLRRRGDRLAIWTEGLLGATAMLVLGRAVLASPSLFLTTDLLLAVALLTVGWRRPATAYFILGWALLALAPVHRELALAADGPLLGRAALLLALLVALGAAAAPLARRSDREPLSRAIPPTARATSILAILLALPSATDAGWTWSLAGLLGVALAQGTLARLLGTRADWHLGGCALYAAWTVVLDRQDLTTTEAWLAPPALWLLFWGERYRAEGRRVLSEALSSIGAVLLLAPPLLSSAGPHGVGHLVFLVAASLGLLLHGIGRRRRVHAVAGSVALLLEMALQALRLAVLVPWWYVALASGLLLVGLGILFERRRRDILTAGQQIFSEVAGW